MSLSGRGSHGVMIYGYENEKFKVKDSHGKKYEIPIDRLDYDQVLRSKQSGSNFNKIFSGKNFPIH